MVEEVIGKRKAIGSGERLEREIVVTTQNSLYRSENRDTHCCVYYYVLKIKEEEFMDQFLPPKAS